MLLPEPFAPSTAQLSPARQRQFLSRRQLAYRLFDFHHRTHAVTVLLPDCARKPQGRGVIKTGSGVDTPHAARFHIEGETVQAVVVQIPGRGGADAEFQRR